MPQGERLGRTRRVTAAEHLPVGFSMRGRHYVAVDRRRSADVAVGQAGLELESGVHSIARQAWIESLVDFGEPDQLTSRHSGDAVDRPQPGDDERAARLQAVV